MADQQSIAGQAFAGAKNMHPHRLRWLEDEARMRASYLAVRRLLAPFLVPHRFEGDQKAEDLRRAKYGYGVGLNKAYLSEIMGHVASAGVEYRWGVLSGDKDTITAPPTKGAAQVMWGDATRDGVAWPRFFAATVLEWILSSVGGFVIVDSPSIPTATKADEVALGKRPFVRWAPWSSVEDKGEGADGYRFLKFAEHVDERMPDGNAPDYGLRRYHLLYELTDTGTTTVKRYDDSGQLKGDVRDLGKFVDRTGRPTLPIIAAKYGTHPELACLGAGLILDLADIVIDLFNLVSEVREGFRDACFGLIQHTGPDGEKVQKMLEDGSRFVTLGDTTGAKLERMAADPQEAASGIELVSMAVRAWALAARRKAHEAQQDAANARSGLSLLAEFQLDLKPLLVSVANTLNDIESQVMFIAAQMAGETPEAGSIGVTRNTDFRLEDEASRISRIVGDAVRSMDLPAEALVQITMRWLEASGLFDDLDEPADPAQTDGTPAGKRGTLRQVLEREVRELASAKQNQKVREREMMPGDSAFPGAA